MAAHEVFLAHAPRAGDSREHCPLVPRRKARGPIATQYAGEEVAAGVAVIGAAEERRELALAVPRVWIANGRRRAGIQVVDPVRIGDEALRCRRELAVVVLDVLIAADHFELMTRAEVRRVREQ